MTAEERRSCELRISRCFFFFSSRRRHTRCSRDWSSDVCSSDLSEESRLALFAGRPVRWDAGGHEADGAGPLDPRTYLEPSAAWRDALDGRWAAARYDDAARELEVGADALGAYPLFGAEAHGARWFSNAPAALASLAGARELDPLALAGLLGGGWSPAADP